jgi:Na+-transporting NADH:ubiquinone oxidoreductase subunit NqrB
MRRLRRRGYRFPGIALSGYGQDEDIRRSHEAGFAAHLTKPASREAVVEAVTSVTTGRATDPVSAAQTNPGRFVYGALIGATISLIRVFSIWSGAVMFAVLLGNMFNPIVDYYVKQRKKKGAAT